MHGGTVRLEAFRKYDACQMCTCFFISSTLNWLCQVIIVNL